LGLFAGTGETFKSHGHEPLLLPQHPDIAQTSCHAPTSDFARFPAGLPDDRHPGNSPFLSSWNEREICSQIGNWARSPARRNIGLPLFIDIQLFGSAFDMKDGSDGQSPCFAAVF
jgi:hypothetical protein